MSQKQKVLKLPPSTNPDFISENDALDYLAGIYVNIYFNYAKKVKNN